MVKRRTLVTAILSVANLALLAVGARASDDPPLPAYPNHSCFLHPSNNTCRCGEVPGGPNECDGPDSCDCAFYYDCTELY
jgi:hypothetical protein